MNIAISSLILIFLLLPSLFFRTFLIKSDALENPLDTSIKTELGIILFIALIQHLIGYYILKCFSYTIEFDQFYYILNSSEKKIDDTLLKNSFIPFFQYILFLIIISIPLSLLLKKFLFKNYLDIKWNLPITNEWDDLLSGRIFELDIKENVEDQIKSLEDYKKEIQNTISNDNTLNKDEIKRKIKESKLKIKNKISSLKNELKSININYVEADIHINTSEGDYIYKGRIYKYYLAKDNKLDKIVLKNVYKRKLKNCENEKFEEFKSKLFVIKYDDIKSLNIRTTYYKNQE